MNQRDSDFIKRAKQSVGNAEEMMNTRAEHARIVRENQMNRSRRSKINREETSRERHEAETVWEATKEKVEDAIESVKETVSDVWKKVAGDEEQEEQ